MKKQRCRFVVRSADEAVKVLQERFGGNAKVVSVRQVEGQGLSRFLSAPKLEITAEVSFPEVASDEPSTVAPEPEVIAAAPVREPEPERVVKPVANEESLLVRLVRAAGISAPVLARLQAHGSWHEIERLPAGRALTRVAELLAAELDSLPARPLGNRIVFLGSPGSGKTTALCKLLATDIFLRQRRGVVLKLDLDSANPSDGLSVFCDALGVPCARTVVDVPELDPDTQLYVDLPGLALDDAEHLERLSEELTPLAPTSHVLVLNAAYDPGILKHLCRAGEQVGCTHLVLTHCDELIHWGKLWDVLLGSRLTPLFLSTGQNVAGDVEENVIPAILSRTFPSLGKEAAKEAVAP
jgi:flagellar biosynthesis protein FlhF